MLPSLLPSLGLYTSHKQILGYADEVQACFQPGDEAELAMLRMALKQLLLAGPRHVMFVLTGSSMAAAWVNIALMHPRGPVLLTHHRRLDLPTMYCRDDMDYVWQALRKRHPALPQELVQWAEPTPAMLSNLARKWLESRKPAGLCSRLHQSQCHH